MLRSPESLSRRYVAWVRRRTGVILAGHAVVLAIALYLIAFRLPLFSDFSYLLPQDAPSVQDLRRLEARVQTTDTVLVLVQAPTAAERTAAGAEMAAGMRALPHEIIEHVDDNDTEVRAFLRAHRHLFVSLADLQKADAALSKKLHDAKLKANPLFINLDDDDAPAGSDAGSGSGSDHSLEDLKAKRQAFEAKYLDKSTTVSADGLTQKIEVRTAFRGTDAGHGHQLLALMETVRARVIADHPGATVGFTGGIVTAVAEHNAILNGMLLSSIVTTLLVGVVLALYFRSATLLILLVGTLGVATMYAFGAAALTIGHLNAATAFLGAIIAGNGINYGILLISRFLEERRDTSRDDAGIDVAFAEAIVGTIRPTAVASLGASIAYGSLAATSFKGFADFAVIGAIGMTLCWIESYLLLPALVLRFGRRTRVFHGNPVVGTTLVKLFGFRRSGLVCVVGGLVLVASLGITYRYVAADPFEYDIKRLRSEGDDAVLARRWMTTSDQNFGRGYSGRTYIAADHLPQVALIVKALRAVDNGLPEDRKTIGDVRSYLDAVPPDQDQKLAVLAHIRTLLDDKALDALSEDERKDLRELRPPDDLQAITFENLPAPIRDPMTEKDGRIGYLISIRPANKLDEWNGHDNIRFANAIKKLALPDGETVTTSGAAVIFADILVSISGDGPLVTSIASGGLVVMCLLLVGPNRRAFAVLVATGAGSILMIAACALLGLKVNFLDFVALPITLGIGVDYAINIAHRHDHEEIPDPLTTLRTSGAAVFVCSLTTIIGYGSLLVSDNLAIRGFGTASLIGEVMCLLSALILVPALLAVGRHGKPIALRSAGKPGRKPNQRDAPAEPLDRG